MQQYPPGSTQPTPVVHPQPLYPSQPPRKRMTSGTKAALVFLAVLLFVAGSFTIGILANGYAASQSSQDATATAQSLDASNALTATAIVNMNATESAASNALSNDLTAQAMTPTPIPTTPVETTGIGATQSSGAWNITVNSIKVVVSDNQFEVPRAGNEFIDINVTTVNMDTATQQMNPLYFTLRDDSGTQYNWDGLTIAHSIFGTVVSGQKLRGDLTYEVPKTDHSFTLQFDTLGDFSNSQVVQWNLTV